MYFLSVFYYMDQQKKMYVYTRKDASIASMYQNVDLIPKLFHNESIYQLRKNPSNDEGKHNLQLILLDIKDKFRGKYPDKILNKLNIYHFLLYDYVSDVMDKVKFTYVSDENKVYVIQMLEYMIEYNLLDNTDNVTEVDLFIEYLLRAHQEMEYGLYFSVKVAIDDADFYRQALLENKEHFDIIYFTELENFLQYVYTTKKYFIDNNPSFSFDLLYANTGWQYGSITEDSVVLDQLDFNQFEHELYRIHENSNDVEIICQIPLPTSVFKYIHIEKGIDFKKKYMKYKQKYLELRDKHT